MLITSSLTCIHCHHPVNIVSRTTLSSSFFFFFFNDTATTEIYTLSLHDALPISARQPPHGAGRSPELHHALDRSRSRHGLDRKSTRLNSSHSQISYAVFCLKKKKKEINKNKNLSSTPSTY